MTVRTVHPDDATGAVAPAHPDDASTATARARTGSQRGQATVELTALLPLLAVVALSAYAVLAARTADEH